MSPGPLGPFLLFPMVNLQLPWLFLRSRWIKVVPLPGSSPQSLQTGGLALCPPDFTFTLGEQVTFIGFKKGQVRRVYTIRCQGCSGLA